jgi:hypothetical protein
VRSLDYWLSSFFAGGHAAPEESAGQTLPQPGGTEAAQPLAVLMANVPDALNVECGRH